MDSSNKYLIFLGDRDPDVTEGSEGPFVTLVEKKFQRKKYQLFTTKYQIFHLNSSIFSLNSGIFPPKLKVSENRFIKMCGKRTKKT